MAHFSDKLQYADNDPEEFTDDEDIDLTVSAEAKKRWDVFTSSPPSTRSLSDETNPFFEGSIQVIKLVVYLLTFIVVLGSGVLSKGLLMLMTSQLRTDRTIPVCGKADLDLSMEKDYEAVIPWAEKVVWAWVIFFTFLVPEAGTFLRSLRICLFKSPSAPLFGHFLIVLLLEMLHTVGCALLVFAVMPEIDVVRGLMLTNCVCFIPGILGMLTRDPKHSRAKIYLGVDIAAVMFQLMGFVAFPTVVALNEKDNVTSWWIWLTPVALLLTSLGWWENFVEKKNTNIKFIKYMANVKEKLWDSRYTTYLVVPVFKVAVFFATMVACVSSRVGGVANLMNTTYAFGSHAINISEVRKDIDANVAIDFVNDFYPRQSVVTIQSDGSAPFMVFVTQFLFTWLCYVTGKLSCRILMQRFGFAFSSSLTIPVTISLLVTVCGLRHNDLCGFSFMPWYLFWDCKNSAIFNDFINNDFAWLWIFWFLSQLWITGYIWSPKNMRLSSTEELFVTPMYNGLLIDQSIVLNRRRGDVYDDGLNNKSKHSDGGKGVVNPDFVDDNEIGIRSHQQDGFDYRERDKVTDKVTHIYACATMWHENPPEMLEMLKSIYRMDIDQCSRRLFQKHTGKLDMDYYEYETHIFFDDAFRVDKESNEFVVNSFVEDLVTHMEVAGAHIYQIPETDFKLKKPKKFPTPYGGRLVWTLPGKTKIICHLKNKDKIRHKKRWSQVMYMYYLLGYKLMEQPWDLTRKETVAENTYLLALDGDIDFKPDAVLRLVHLMKRPNSNLGAACGRIHPVGSGIMVWYQMFEYAIGHWLQKATEHMIGCVLCSPGCFSLFKGRALMDDNIMAKYTTTSTQARHYVQFDQGEDRWLCTLLLQKGYRVEYSAASDAYTHAPEGFGEFYNQRRRWVPSTMANIMDLLQDYKKTTQNNDNISMLYILYQVMLLVGTILGPGTIFLMIVGAFAAAFEITLWTGFVWNLVPILIFMLTCFYTKSKTQITIAYILTAVYALVMIIVLVGMIMNFITEGINTPTAIFFFATAASFIITGILHPQEIICLPCGLIYYMVVPSMYLLLQIYSCFNLNDVSWGTRDVPASQQQKSKAEIEAAQKALEEKKKKDGLFAFLYKDETDKKKGSIEFSCAGLFKFMFCLKENDDQTKTHLESMASSLVTIQKKLEDKDSQNFGQLRRRSSLKTSIDSNGKEHTEIVDNSSSDEGSEKSDPRAKGDLRDDLINPYWIEDKTVSNGPADFLTAKETIFWQDLIEKYLKPLMKDKKTQEKAEVELKELRNMVVFSFLMMNAIFVVAVFLMQLNNDIIYINWGLGVRTNVTFIENGLLDPVIEVLKDYQKLEPIGMLFVGFFAVILVVQFVAMCLHRFGTLCHILADTTLTIFCFGSKEDGTEELKNEILRSLQENKEPIQSPVGDGRRASVHPLQKRRQTIHQLEQNVQRKTAVLDLDRKFEDILEETERPMSESQNNPRRSSIFGKSLGNRSSVYSSSPSSENRRRSVMFSQLAARKQSMLQTDQTDSRPVSRTSPGTSVTSKKSSVRFENDRTAAV